MEAEEHRLGTTIKISDVCLNSKMIVSRDPLSKEVDVKLYRVS